MHNYVSYYNNVYLIAYTRAHIHTHTHTHTHTHIVKQINKCLVNQKR